MPNAANHIATIPLPISEVFAVLDPTETPLQQLCALVARSAPQDRAPHRRWVLTGDGTQFEQVDRRGNTCWRLDLSMGRGRYRSQVRVDITRGDEYESHIYIPLTYTAIHRELAALTPA